MLWQQKSLACSCVCLLCWVSTVRAKGFKLLLLKNVCTNEVRTMLDAPPLMFWVVIRRTSSGGNYFLFSMPWRVSISFLHKKTQSLHARKHPELISLDNHKRSKIPHKVVWWPASLSYSFFWSVRTNQQYYYRAQNHHTHIIVNMKWKKVWHTKHALPDAVSWKTHLYSLI